MSGSTSRRRGAAFGFIMATILLDMLAMAIVLPVLPALITGLVGGGAGLSAHVFGAFGAAWAAMQFIASPMLGALSDRFGRRPVILLSCLGQAVDFTPPSCCCRSQARIPPGFILAMRRWHSARRWRCSCIPTR